MLTIFLLSSVLAVSAKTAQETPLLDLTHFPAPDETRSRSWGAGGLSTSSSGNTNELIPLEIELRLFKEVYSANEGFDFELLLSNRGPQRIALPWQPDWRLVEKGHEKPPSGYVTASFGLRVTREGESGDFSLGSLFGSHLANNSIIYLQPGGKARIKGRADWPFDTRPFRTDNSNSRIQLGVTGWFRFIYPPDFLHHYLPSESSPPVPMEIVHEQE